MHHIDSVRSANDPSIDKTSMSRDHSLQDGQTIKYRDSTDQARVDERGKDYVPLPDQGGFSQTCTDPVDISSFGFDDARAIATIQSSMYYAPSVDSHTGAVTQGTTEYRQDGTKYRTAPHAMVWQRWDTSPQISEMSPEMLTPTVMDARSVAPNHDLTTAGQLITSDPCQPVVINDENGTQHWYRLSAVSQADRAAGDSVDQMNQKLTRNGSSVAYVVTGAGREESGDDGFNQRYEVIETLTPVDSTGSLHLPDDMKTP